MIKALLCAWPELPPPWIKQEKTISCPNPLGIHKSPERGLPPSHNVRANRTWCAGMMHSSHWHLHRKHIPRGRWKLSAPWQPRHRAKKQQTWIQLLPQGEGTQRHCSHEPASTTILRKSLKEKPPARESTSLQPRSAKWKSKMRPEKEELTLDSWLQHSALKKGEIKIILKISPLGSTRQPQFFTSSDFNGMTQTLQVPQTPKSPEIFCKGDP